MTIKISRNIPRGLSRRRFLSTAAATGALGAIAMPHLGRAAVPAAGIAHARAVRRRRRRMAAVACGALRTGRRNRWSRSPLTQVFQQRQGLARRSRRRPRATSPRKCSWKTCPPGRTFFYRVRFRDLAHTDVSSEPVVGRFRTAPADRRDVSFVWGGDVAGQGWGINPDDGGMVTFATMARHKPDFLLHSGDSIYADGIILPEVKLPDGKVWKNVTIPEKAKVAETLDEFRAAHKYNFLDDNVRAFNAEVPIFVQWDDHEVTNNWSASKQLPAAYKERDVMLLAARSARAFHEMYPMRESIVEPGRVYRTHPLWAAASTSSSSTSAAIADPTAPNLPAQPHGPDAATSSGPTQLRMAEAAGCSPRKRHLEGDRHRHAASASSSMTTHPTRKARRHLRKATGRRAAANWKSPICCASSRPQASPTRYG